MRTLRDRTELQFFRFKMKIFFTISSICFLMFLSCFRTQNYLSPEGPKFRGTYSSNTQKFRDTVKVVTFNIRYGENIARAIEEFRRFYELRRADIILLQEMDETGSDSLARALKCNYVYFPASVHPRTHRNFGNAILSPWPIRESEKILLPYQAPFGKTRRIAVKAVVLIKNHPVLTYSVHTATFLSSGAQRLAQADSMLKSIPQQFTHVIIGGDFNTVFSGTREKLHTLFSANGFQNATANIGATARFLFLKKQLDHIFVKGFQVLQAGTVDTSRASDHFPVWVTLLPRK